MSGCEIEAGIAEQEWCFSNMALVAHSQSVRMCNSNYRIPRKVFKPQKLSVRIHSAMGFVTVFVLELWLAHRQHTEFDFPKAFGGKRQKLHGFVLLIDEHLFDFRIDVYDDFDDHGT